MTQDIPDLIDQARVASPCSMKWDDLQGDGPVRHRDTSGERGCHAAGDTRHYGRPEAVAAEDVLKARDEGRRLLGDGA